MKRLVFGVLVFALFVGEAMWAAWHDGDGPLTQLAGGTVHDSRDLKAIGDPLHGWSPQNQTLDAILASAVWPKAAACVRPACSDDSAGTQRPL